MDAPHLCTRSHNAEWAIAWRAQQGIKEGGAKRTGNGKGKGEGKGGGRKGAAASRSHHNGFCGWWIVK